MTSPDGPCNTQDPQELTQFMKLVKEKGNIPIFLPPLCDKEALWEIRRTENIAFTTGVKLPHSLVSESSLFRVKLSHLVKNSLTW